MSDSVWVRGYYGEQYVLVDGSEVLELRTEAEARRFLEELGEEALESVDPRALPAGLRNDFEGATGSRDDQLAVLAQMLSSGQFTVVRLQRPFGRLDPVKSVRLSDLRQPQIVEPPAPTKVKDTFAYQVRVVDEVGDPVGGVPVSLSVSGSPRQLVTDGDGRVKVDDATTGTAVARLTDLAALQDALRPRWEQPRGGTWLDESEDHTYVDCSDPLPSVQVRASRLHTIAIQPRVICARVLELLFDTNKSFLLPSALEHIRAVRRLYDQRPRAKVLIVGHTDVTGEPNVNDPLSLNRARAVRAYLTDDVKAWLDFYGDHMHPKARWGSTEDLLMLSAVLAESGEELIDTPVRHFQATHGLDVDGDLGPITREAIIAEYMAIDGTTLPAGIEPIAHGCGENFPLDKTDGQGTKNAHAHDRRVELFFFDGDLGVLPPPSGDNSAADSPEYPDWRRRSSETHDFIAKAPALWEVRFIDRTGQPMAGTDFAVQFGAQRVVLGTADDDGVGIVHLPPNCPERVLVAWGPASGSREFSFARSVHVDCTGGPRERGLSAMLHNLGYAPDASLAYAVEAFRLDESADETSLPIESPSDEISDVIARSIEALYQSAKGLERA